MEYKEFFDRIKADNLPRCLLLHGEEEYIKEAAVDRLRAALLPAGLEVMNEAVFEGNADEGAIIEACEQLPFMSERRLVIVRDHPLLLTGGDGARLAEYLPDLPGQTTLAFVVRGNADMRRKLTGAIGKIGAIVVCRQMEERDVYAYLKRDCARAEKEISHAALERLVFLCGRDLTVLKGEIEKAIAHAGETAEVTAADVDAVAVPSLEANVFQMVDAVLDGQCARAEELRRALVRDGESPIMILAVLVRNLRQLRHARTMLAAKRPRAEIEKAVGISGYVANRVIRRASTLEENWLGQMQALCEQADYEIKSGRMKEDIALDRAMLALMRV